jgi:hypothetical protein
MVNILIFNDMFLTDPMLRLRGARRIPPPPIAIDLSEVLAAEVVALQFPQLNAQRRFCLHVEASIVIQLRWRVANNLHIPVVV